MLPTVRQREGLSLLTALLVLFVTSTFLFKFYFSPLSALPEGLGEGEGNFPVALNVRGEERGIYFLHPGAKLSTLLKFVGLNAFLAEEIPLSPGDKVFIEMEGCVRLGRMDTSSLLALGIPLDINRVQKEDLLLLRGVGEKTAQAILDLRKQKGRIKDISELLEVRGIGEKKLEELMKDLAVSP